MSLLERLRNRKSALRTTLEAGVNQNGAVLQLSANRPDDASAMMMVTANRHFQAGDLTAARELYVQMLEADPSNARAYYMLSGVAAKDGDLSSAVGLIHRAIALQPAVPEFHFSLATLRLSTGSAREALSSYREALRLRPESRDYQRSVAGAFMAAGMLDDGIQAYRAIAAVGKTDADAYFDLGKALQLRGDFKEAEEKFVEVIRLTPDSAEANLHLAVVRREQGRPVDAEGPARRAIELSPDMQAGWFVLGGVLGDQGRHVEAVEHFRKVLSMQADDDAAWSGVLFSMNYSEQFSAREIFEEHLKYGERFSTASPVAIDSGRLRSGRRVRIGYLSPDFWLHPVAHFMAPILAHHDRGVFEVYCYHIGKREDAMTARLRTGVEHWRQLTGVSDEELEQTLRRDKLDILVELTGHSDHQRLAVLATRVAPIQVTYLGYPNTTGVAAIDYRLTDDRADPPGESDKLHTEQLVRLPETFLCYAPPAVDICASSAPINRNGHVTFGSFNNFAKLSPITIKLWSQILASVPNSRLLVKTRGLQDLGLRMLLLNRFGARGISADRIEVMAPILDQRQHLGTYGEIDIALDPFPYNGTTTTMEALWMGIPVVTLEGDRHAARVGASILSCLGLPDLVGRSEEEYVEIAVQLAASRSKLEVLRQSLRTRLSQSPLTDGARFTAQLEHAYFRMLDELSARSPASSL